MIPIADHYWLTNAHVPVALLQGPIGLQPTKELVAVDLEIQAGLIRQIVPAGTRADSPDVISSEVIPSIDLNRRLVWSCFVDLHTHLDKGHIWPRTPNVDGTFNSALELNRADREQYWSAEEVYRRMEFGLKCSYAHGTQAIRTHIDSHGKQAAISFQVFKALQQQWANRLTLQASALVPLDYFATPEGEQLADQAAEVGGLIGGFAQMSPDLDQQIDRVFALAQERGLNLDFHTDETGDPSSITLRHVAAAALRHEFTGQIVCGHCCSLSVQPVDEVLKTLELVKRAGIGIVSLPMCNLYLQDRNPLEPQNQQASPFTTRTPRWRGVTLAHELKQFGIPVAFASDNCRDPFYAYGDHDGWEVFTQAVRIAQLDAPLGDWCRSVTTVPADLMGLPQAGRLAVGLPANLIVFKARNFNEWLARPQADRIVLRQGKPINAVLPDYAELDDLYGSAV
jgi:cytosine/creatinine deaminase